LRKADNHHHMAPNSDRSLTCHVLQASQFCLWSRLQRSILQHATTTEYWPQFSPELPRWTLLHQPRTVTAVSGINVCTQKEDQSAITVHTGWSHNYSIVHKKTATTTGQILVSSKVYTSSATWTTSSTAISV